MKDYKKKYEKTEERAKNIYNSDPYNSIVRAVCEQIFPELKESEDERIRKVFRGWIYTQPSSFFDNGISKEEMLAWLEKQGEQTSPQTNERAWLYLVSDVLTWKDGIGQYLDNPKVQELAKKLCSKYAQKIYNPSVLSNFSNTGNNNQEPVNKVEPKFHEGDIIIHKELGGDYIHNSHKIIQVDILDKKYRLEGGLVAHFSEQDDYELVEQKPTWSEEDERILVKIQDHLREFYVDKKGYPYVAEHDSPEMMEFYWLKSLKERMKGE